MSANSTFIRHSTFADNSADDTSGIAWYAKGGINGCIFYNLPQTAIYQSATSSRITGPALTNNLFFKNPQGDFKNKNKTVYTGGQAINLNVAGSSGNLDGDPKFTILNEGHWTFHPIYNPKTFRTTLTDISKSFTPDSMIGNLINPNSAQSLQGMIAANTTSTLEVWGDVTSFVKFADAYQIKDYHLGYGSAAIDQDTSENASLFDLEGTTRPIDINGQGNDGNDKIYDIGAYEARPISRFAVTSWLDFGNRAPNSGPTAPLTVTLENIGFLPISFTGAKMTWEGVNLDCFSISGTKPTLTDMAPGEKRQITLVYNPKTLGPKIARLAFITNDSQQPIHKALLVGHSMHPLPAMTPEPGWTKGFENSVAWLPEGGGAKQYRLSYATKQDFTMNCLTTTIPMTLTSYTAKGLADDTSYWYKIAVMDSLGFIAGNSTTSSTQDAKAPSSGVYYVSPEIKPLQVLIRWSASDSGQRPSGLKSVGVYWRDDKGTTGTITGSPFSTNTTSAYYTAPRRSVYYFYSIATDLVGNVEPKPSREVKADLSKNKVLNWIEYE
jgi:hypothetical protein